MAGVTPAEAFFSGLLAGALERWAVERGQELDGPDLVFEPDTDMYATNRFEVQLPGLGVFVVTVRERVADLQVVENGG